MVTVAKFGIGEKCSKYPMGRETKYELVGRSPLCKLMLTIHILQSVCDCFVSV